MLFGFSVVLCGVGHIRHVGGGEIMFIKIFIAAVLGLLATASAQFTGSELAPVSGLADSYYGVAALVVVAGVVYVVGKRILGKV